MNPPSPKSKNESTPAVEPAYSSRLTANEIAGRLRVGRLAVYAMLKDGIIPAVRVGRRWIITRLAYEEWERTCGRRSTAGLMGTREVTVN